MEKKVNIFYIVYAILFLAVFFLSKADAAGPTKYVFPLDEPVMVNGKILCTAWFSYKRQDMNGSKYEALNYPAREGSTVKACIGGTVKFAKYFRYSGNTVRVINDDGTELEYCHLDSYVVHGQYINKGKFIPGSRVEAGDVIGFVGRTGRTTGSHLRLVRYRVVNGVMVKDFICSEDFNMAYNDFVYRAGSAKEELKFDFL